MQRLPWPRLPGVPGVRLLLAAALALGCSPEIGDECGSSVDCSQTGDRLCDTTQPGGYCTLYNCEPGACPEEATCVAFHTNVSAAPGCEDPQGGSRLRRTFCMRRCWSQSDCRAGYVCADVNPVDDPWRAELAEQGRKDGRVCLVPVSEPPVEVDAGTDICRGGAGGFGNFDAGAAGSGGVAGAGGTAGTAGTAGAGAVSGAGGTAGTAGSGGTAGTAGSGGTAGTAGTGGTSGTAGTGGTAGTAGTGGTSGTAGTGGTAGTAGTGGTAGTAGTGGTAGTAGSGAAAGADGG